MTLTPLVVFNMRDRLYAFICSSDMGVQIMGWSSGKWVKNMQKVCSANAQLVNVNIIVFK